MKPTRPSTSRAPRKRGPNSVSKSLTGNTFSVAAFKALDPFPPNIRRKFKYCSRHTLYTDASTGGFGGEQRYSLNSLYDPDVSGGGHQPYGFDQVFALYNKYRVDKVTFRITFTTPGSNADLLCAAVLTPVSSGSSLSAKSIEYPLEWPNIQHGHLSSAGSRVCYLTGTADLWTIVGVTQQKYVTDDTFASLSSTSPTQAVYMNLAVGSYSGATSEACSMLVELEFDAVAYDRIVQSSS